MIRLARELLRVADDLMTDLVFVYDKDEWPDERVLDDFFWTISSYVARIQRNEDVRSFVSRHDDERFMRIRVGLGDHEAKDAIMDAIKKKADRMVKKARS